MKFALVTVFIDSFSPGFVNTAVQRVNYKCKSFINLTPDGKKTVLTNAGIDTGVYKAHSTREIFYNCSG